MRTLITICSGFCTFFGTLFGTLFSGFLLDGRKFLRQLAVLALVSVSLFGCKTKEDADQPTVLGKPARAAYLGVEYYYNFGAFGGDAILDYSLSNAPPWLALEDTANKARPGIIARGIPGVTGGSRGEASLGTTKNINLTTTDGERLGVQPFEIEVRPNKVSLQSGEITEGQSAGSIEGAGEGMLCAEPDISTTGRQEITYNQYNPDGSLDTTETDTFDTNPVLVKVVLEKPSELITKLAFELRSDYSSEPEACNDPATPPNQACEFSTLNLQKAQLGKDVVLRGNKNDEGGENLLPQPDYIEQLDERSGVITLQPGITECYIRLEVVDDEFSEPTESFNVALTEVRQGLVALGDNRDEITQGVSITDNAPVVAFQTQKGFDNGALSEGEQRTYKAVLDRRGGSESDTYRVRLARGEKSSAEDADYRFLEATSNGTSNKSITEVDFPPNVNEREFIVEAIDDDADGSPPTLEDPADLGPLNEDDRLVITADEAFQNGRPFYAGQGQDLELTINDLTTEISPVGSEAAGTEATDIAVGDFGRIFVARQEKQADGTYLAQVVIYDRFGKTEAPYSIDTGSTVPPRPQVDFVERSITQASNTIPRYEVGLAYQTDGAAAGTTNAGGLDTGFVLLRRDAGLDAYAEVWHTQYGTSGDDVLRAFGFNNGGSFFVAGETSGVWPGETAGGGTDIYTQRINSVISGSAEIPNLVFTAQTGSGLDESTIGLGITPSTAYGVGITRGQPGITPQIGGDDILITQNSGTKDAEQKSYQVGTELDDKPSAAIDAGNRIFLTGSAPFLYKQELDDQLNAILTTDSSVSSNSGFLLSYSLTGELDAGLSFNDEAATGNERLDALVPFDGSIITGGGTNGRFDSKVASDGGPILARLTRDRREVERERDDGSGKVDGNVVGDIKENWRAQFPEFGPQARIVALANYKNQKMAALITWMTGDERREQLVLINGDGELLTDSTP